MMSGKYDSILIDQSARVKDAMRKLDKTEEKILFVVNNHKELIGSLTDGDIRRWILKDGSLGAFVYDACFKGTYFVESGFDLDIVKEDIRKRKVVYVPVLDSNRRIIEFLVWNELFGDINVRKQFKSLSNPVIIMAGGKGTRLDPFTKILPKPLIPIGEKTILELIIEKFTFYEINTFYISVNHKAKIIRSYFEEINPIYKINYLHEDSPLGTGGALWQLRGIFSEPIFVTNCDILIDSEYDEIANFHNINKNDITIVGSMKHYAIPYGVLKIENGGAISEMQEKPEFDLIVNTGMYLLNPDVLELIPENTFYNMTDLVESARKLGKTVKVFPISEYSWTDIGEWVEYKKAVEKLKI
ncbi:MAG: NTP transferase domain-containing protein [Ignavibacteriaceae bacterium]|nr:NTP transferase domain-containing protein [Ignavibacteriaceae bacterium]